MTPRIKLRGFGCPAVTLSCAALLLPALHAQKSGGGGKAPSPSPPPVSTSSRGGEYDRPSTTATTTFDLVPPGGNDFEQHQELVREKLRTDERRKRIVEDTNRLVRLASQLQDDIAAHGGATPEDQKRLEELEKLARSVKDRMRG